ncbi:hypothetical protein GUJ93_ZPchr0006g45418 [Zizania palustris]|uniref:ABC transmembrane type-1 domain-containing protein n=1 Tax=Zizania palustris TaxID=103762 RepID=A0A8J5SNZ8_ZIZPA|nr:hypothetical protein GUJ93_ZPchr0006g45418 [Zizania palustris]
MGSTAAFCGADLKLVAKGRQFPAFRFPEEELNYYWILICTASYAQTKFIWGFGGNAKDMYEQASTIASDAIGNIRTVASFCVEEKIIESYRNKCEARFVHSGTADVGEVFKVFFALTMMAVGVSQCA